jgi:SAM-dependent methyltransferase
MTNTNFGAASYALGYAENEQRRLMHQAALLAPCTERLFRAAGIGPGDHVLDIGSGIGDVSILVSHLVGPTGAVIGVERDPNSIAKAEARVAAASLRNVSFLQLDAGAAAIPRGFDAIVGRFILMYLPDPVQALRSLKIHLRPGGAIAFLEPSWKAVRAISKHLPLYSACAAVIVDSFKSCGANPEMGTAMHKAFLRAGLPEPNMHIDTFLGADPDFARAMCDLLRSLEPRARANGVSLERIGHPDTLEERLLAELRDSGEAIAWLCGHVSAWCHLPDHPVGKFTRQAAAHARERAIEADA